VTLCKRNSSVTLLITKLKQNRSGFSPVTAELSPQNWKEEKMALAVEWVVDQGVD
jgi:hypothetical protein